MKKIKIFWKKCCSLLDTWLSGTPIIQNGKVVGAITHVFVQDSKMGYGTFIENMMVVEWNFNEAGLGICEKKVVQNNLENALLGNICKK